MKNKILAWFFLVTLFLSLFILLNWNSFNSPFERDEGEYAYSAWLLRTGGTPYQDSFLQKPPMVIYTYLAGQFIDPLAVWPPRAIEAIFVLLTSILIGLIALKEWGRMAGIFSSFLFLPLINFPYLSSFAANTEKFMILPMTALLALFVYHTDSKKSWPYVLAGIFSTLAIFYKPICLFVVAFIVIYWMFKLCISASSFDVRRAIRPLLLIIISSIVTAFIVLIPFFKACPKFFQEVVVFNYYYKDIFKNHATLYAGYYFIRFIEYWWILFFLLLGIYIKIPSKFLYYFIIFLISYMTIFSSFLGHYYLMIMPFFVLICGSLFSSLIQIFKNKWKIIIPVAILFITIFCMIYPLRRQFSMSPNELSLWVYSSDNPFTESKEVARQLSKITNKNDQVFIYGSEPQIYYYAERKSSTRFVITYPLFFNTPYQEIFQKELISDLEENPPKAIIISKRSQSGLWAEGKTEIFKNYLSYIISNDYNIVGGYVWQGENNYWEEPINEKDIPNASLLLYAKKNK